MSSEGLQVEAGPSLPCGLELVRIEPNGGSKEAFGFQLAGNRTMGVYVRAILGGTDVDKVRRGCTYLSWSVA